MRIRKKFATLSTPESLHDHRPLSDPPIHPLAAPSRPDLQLTLVRGTNGWICLTDDDCMHSSSSTQVGDSEIGKSSSAPEVLVSDDNSSSAKHVMGMSVYESSAWLDTTVDKELVEETEMIEVNSENMNKMRKKVDRENVTKEDSRCSRVNGQRWRCGKQAVVGYALCSHHSSQGRHKTKANSKDQKQGHTALSSSLPVLLDEEPLIMLKKRKKKKIGIIKNRSISGLLAQTKPQPAPPMRILDSLAIS